MTKRISYQIPFDQYGQLAYANFWQKDIIWKENYIFNDTLEYVKYYHGRSAMHFIFKSLHDDLEYSMFLKDFHNLLINKEIVQGNCVVGTFTFHKKGCNYGIKML